MSRFDPSPAVIQLATELWPYGDDNPHPLGMRHSVAQAIKIVLELEQIDEGNDEPV